MSVRTAVYRLSDAAGVLLYIGMTENPEVRFGAHAATKAWWPLVADRSIEWHDTRDLAKAAEDEAIATERSVHNVAGSPWAPKPRELDADEMTVSEARADLTDAVQRVRLLRKAIAIVGRTRERKPLAALVPVELAEAAEDIGVEDAIAILRKAAQ